MTEHQDEERNNASTIPETDQADQPEQVSETHKSTDGAQIGLAVLVVLAIIASIIMLLAGSTAALKVALLAALWAAVLGFFMVVRYRRQAEERTEELELRERLHQAELDKLAAENKSAELELVAAAGANGIDLDVLAEIKAELATIRGQLEDLSGRDYTYEPAALHAEARRIMEIEARTFAATHTQPEKEEDVDFTQSSAGAPSADAISGRLGSQQSARTDNPLADLIGERTASRAGERASQTAADQSRSESPSQPQAQPKPAPQAKPQTETKPDAEPAVKPAAAKAEQSGAPKAEPFQRAEQSQHEEQPAARKPEERKAEESKKGEPQQEERAQRSGAATFDTGTFQAVKWDQGGDESAKHAQPKVTQGEQPEAPVSRGRRRRDAQREGSVSVAELLAQMKKDK